MNACSISIENRNVSYSNVHSVSDLLLWMSDFHEMRFEIFAHEVNMSQQGR